MFFRISVIKLASTLLLMSLSCLCSAHSAMFPDYYKYDDSDEGPKARKALAFQYSGEIEQNQPQALCIDGLAGDYPCRNVDLQSTLSTSELSNTSTRLNDIWGWTDLSTGAEIAIVGMTRGTVFVDITDSTQPIVLGNLPSHNGGADDWRDIKVYQDHAYIVADGRGNASHGMQVYNLGNLATVTPGATISATTHYDGFGRAHNIAINEDSGFAYVVGSDACGGSGGLYMIDISTPDTPTYAGCYSGDGYTHDTQCVTYQGPDTRYSGNEICIAYNEDSVTVVDVTDKDVPVQLARTPYSGATYTHQGWFLDDTHTYIIVNDELDEITLPGTKTKSYLFDLSLLDDPQALGVYIGPTNATDHNLYTKDGLVYESNYRAGLRILNADNIASGTLNEVAYFDTIPCSNSAQFSGSWSSYIYFPSGNVVTSDIGSGLFVLRPDLAAMLAGANAGEAAINPLCPATPTVSSRKRGGGSFTFTAIGFLLSLIFLRQYARIKTGKSKKNTKII